MNGINTRQRQILELVERGEDVRVNKLAGLFGVSEMTIRRDLTGLENLGKLQRTHGGASMPPVPDSAPLLDRMRHMEASKRAMAARAAMLVEPGHRIFLGSGSSILALAQQLSAGPSCQALTTTPEIAQALVSRGRNTVDLTGGRYEPTYRNLVGPRVLEAVRERLFDVAFISAYSIDAELGVLDNGELQHLMQPILAWQSRRFVVIADNTKISRPANYRSMEWSAVDVLITDRPPEPAFAQRVTDDNVELIVCDPVDDDADLADRPSDVR